MRRKPLLWLLALGAAQALAPARAAAADPPPTLAEILPRLGTDLDAEGRFPEAVDPAIYHFACVAVASGSADACAGLAAAAIQPGGMSMDRNCRRRFAEAVLARTLLRREPRAEAACADLMLAVGVEDAARRRGLCGRILADAGGLAGVCRELADRPDEVEGCVVALRIVLGVPVDCGRLAGAGFQEHDVILCRAVQALRERERVPGAARCAQQPLCRAMAGLRPDRCEAYAEQARQAFSARIDLSADVSPQTAALDFTPEDLKNLAAAGAPAASTHVYSAAMDYPYAKDAEPFQHSGIRSLEFT